MHSIPLCLRNDGCIPAADVDALQAYWDVCSQLRQVLFTELRPGYLDLQVDKAAIKTTIYQHRRCCINHCAASCRLAA